MADIEHDYEALRLQNIRQNAQLLLSLGLDKDAIRLRPLSSETKPRPAKKHRDSSAGGEPSGSTLPPRKKSSRIASSAPRSYSELPQRQPREKRDKPERVFRDGSRKSNRALGRPRSGRYKDWDSDDSNYCDHAYAPYAKGQGDHEGKNDDQDDDDSDVERRKHFSHSYRGRRDGSETFVELPRATQLKKLKNPVFATPSISADENGGISDAPLTPEEMLRGGAFGGTAFRPHYSPVLQRDLDVDAELAELPVSWLEGLDVERLLTNVTYDATKNRFGVKAGQSLEEWEKAGWIHAQDPRGWHQWYTRFYLGRRSADDERQIGRWLKACGPAGRFKKMLVQKVAAAGGAWDDASVNSTVRQTLWQWGYDLTKADYLAYL